MRRNIKKFNENAKKHTLIIQEVEGETSFAFAFPQPYTWRCLVIFH